MKKITLYFLRQKDYDENIERQKQVTKTLECIHQRRKKGNRGTGQGEKMLGIIHVISPRYDH